MKNKIWLLQIPFVLIFVFAFSIDEMGVRGELQNKFFRETLAPSLRRVSSFFTDIKFKIRGPQKPKNKIIVLEIDSEAIDRFGRWPWHRDIYAEMIHLAFETGAKVVGLDMVFSEEDKRVPIELREILKKQKMEALADSLETDPLLAKTIELKKDKLVLGWTSDQTCQPLYTDICPITDQEKVISTYPADYSKYSFTTFESPVPFDPVKSPFMSVLYLLPNINLFHAPAKHSGYFNTFQDPDGVTRKTSLFMMVNGQPYPSLALEMARVGLGEDLFLKLDANQKVSQLGFKKSGRVIPVTPLGAMEINFRGGSRTFDYVRLVDLVSEHEVLEGDQVTGALKGVNKKDFFKDAYVLIGVTALGVFDMRAFPFDSNVAGVEGHANILDNLLSGDMIQPTTFAGGTYITYLLMIVVALIFAFIAERLDAVPAVGLFLLGIIGGGIIDTKLLFARNINWNWSFLYLEMFTVFVVTIAVKYIAEERNKKFIRGAFTKYVAPAVVDSILKDPTKLTVGGERRELTILFSDIRGFTSFSEKMDAKSLSALLNDYLGIMTQIVFANEGTLDKYIGDAIMAFWGAPLNQPKHASNCAKTAIAMMKALHEHQDRLTAKYGVNVEIGIGFNSGVVSVGNMGSDTNFAYTVIGDHVNLASRLEGLTKAYGVTIVTSRFSFDCIEAAQEPLPPHRILDDVKVKGKQKAVELIQVLDQEYNEKGLKLFQEGRALYRQQKWDEALLVFESANVLLAPSKEKMDGPCAEFIQRCKDFKLAPPGESWDGSWEMHSK